MSLHDSNCPGCELDELCRTTAALTARFIEEEIGDEDGVRDYLVGRFESSVDEGLLLARWAADEVKA